MHRGSAFSVAQNLRNCYRIDWDSKTKIISTDEWLKSQPVHTWKDIYDETGYLFRFIQVVNNLITPEEVKIYQDVYEKMLSGDINTADHRHDLGSHIQQRTKTENICQIMWPSLYVEDMLEGPLHKRSEAVSKVIIGEDSALDFDMLIYKAPKTETETPWHQDESYWLDLTDKRAASCWVALDDATVDNGCMWFVSGSHKTGLRKHRPASKGNHVMMTDEVTNDDGKPEPLKAGSCTFHSGRTLHHTEGNSTDRQRRAFITNYRPKAMVEQERSQGFDHGMKGLTGIILKHNPNCEDT